MKRTAIQTLVLLVIVTVVALGQRTQSTSDLPSKKAIQLPNARLAIAPYSPGIEAGNMIYLSGNIGIDASTSQLVAGGFEPELRQIFTNAQALLKVANADLSNVVMVTAYLADMKDYARFNEVYGEYFKVQPFPTRTTVAVKELPRGARVELTMTAMRTK